jgi:hypothetical protein
MVALWSSCLTILAEHKNKNNKKEKRKQNKIRIVFFIFILFIMKSKKFRKNSRKQLRSKKQIKRSRKQKRTRKLQKGGSALGKLANLHNLISVISDAKEKMVTGAKEMGGAKEEIIRKITEIKTEINGIPKQLLDAKDNFILSLKTELNESLTLFKEQVEELRKASLQQSRATVPV